MTKPDFKSNIFVTGVFGSGKTFFCRNFIRSNPKYVHIDFDKHYDYPSGDLSLVYKEMKEHRKFIMDALPLNGTPEALERLKNYFLTNSCTIVLIKCHVETWLARLASKSFYNEKNLEQYRRNHKDFYGPWVRENLLTAGGLLSAPRGDEMIVHNSTRRGGR